MKQYYVYILKCRDTKYYTGVTNNMERRLLEHETGFDKRCFTYSRRPVTLVFYERYTDIMQAIAREKQIKGWTRAKKEALITSDWEKLKLLAKGRDTM